MLVAELRGSCARGAGGGGDASLDVEDAGELSGAPASAPNTCGGGGERSAAAGWAAGAAGRAEVAGAAGPAAAAAAAAPRGGCGRSCESDEERGTLPSPAVGSRFRALRSTASIICAQACCSDRLRLRVLPPEKRESAPSALPPSRLLGMRGVRCTGAPRGAATGNGYGDAGVEAPAPLGAAPAAAGDGEYTAGVRRGVFHAPLPAPDARERRDASSARRWSGSEPVAVGAGVLSCGVGSAAPQRAGSGEISGSACVAMCELRMGVDASGSA